MRSALAAAALAALATGVAAQDKPTDTYESKDGKYTITFPGTPKTSSTKAGEVALNVARVEKGSGGFVVIYTDLPADLLKLAKAKDVLDGGVKGLVTNLKATVTSSRDVEFGKQKYPGREVVAEKDKLTVRIKLILAGNRLYQVFVHGPKDVATGKDADKFFESFEITK